METSMATASVEELRYKCGRYETAILVLVGMCNDAVNKETMKTKDIKNVLSSCGFPVSFYKELEAINITKEE